MSPHSDDVVYYFAHCQWYPILLNGMNEAEEITKIFSVDEAEKFTSIFSAAPVWLLEFTWMKLMGPERSQG